MDNTTLSRAKNAVIGALVADAASVGFHWLYDQDRIQTIATDKPEFHSPLLSDYQDVAGYFAHGKKSAGDLSHYGEQAIVLLRSLVANNGHYNRFHYQTQFQQHFGYGGDYIGYIDRPTRDTLDNITQIEKQVFEQANTIAFDRDEQQKQNCIQHLTDSLKQQPDITSEQLLTQCGLSPDAMPYLLQLREVMTSLLDFPGAIDEQLPAIAKLPALAARYAQSNQLHQVTESAVRISNNTDRAVAFGHIASQMIATAITDSSIESAITAANQTTEKEISAMIDNALSQTESTVTDFTKQLGMSCNLEFGVPSIIHNLSQQHSYVESIRQNIYAGGDSCGRAILLGAVLGAVHGLGTEKGIPESWFDQMNNRTEIETLVNALFA